MNNIPEECFTSITVFPQTPEPPSEAAPNSTSPSDPLLVNGKKLSFNEPRRNSVKGREDGNIRSFRDTSKQLHEEDDTIPADATKDANREAQTEDDDKTKAPKFSLRNFRPPSLAKFVPKPKSSSNITCDV